jgi:hypothetical protein
MKWIIIAGCNRNGTTLITKLMTAHPDIDSLPQEGHGIRLVRKNKLVPYGGDEGCGGYWTVREDIFHMTEDTEWWHNNLLKIWELYRMKNGDQSYIVEKDPENCIRTRWMQKIIYEDTGEYPIILGVIRDPYAGSWSIRKDTDADIDLASKHWNRAYELLTEDAKYLKKFKLYKYEDIINNVDWFFDDVSKFIGIDNTFEKTENLSWFTWDGKINKDVNQKRIDNLTEEEKKIITKNTESMRNYYGYKAL